MKNIGRNILYLIFGTIIIVWIGFMVPQEFGFIDETQEDQPVAYIAFWANLITGKGATREAAAEAIEQKNYIREAYKEEIEEPFDVCKLLREHSTDGFYGDAQAVLQEMYRVLDEIITPDMLDADKVRAIHDYLIKNADYYEGDLATRPGWSSSMEGVLLKGTGVCNSYALAFYAMCTAEDIECHMVAGSTTGDGGNGDHAWNRVKLGGSWYFIDCTWDDPIGGGYENYDYYLTASLWADHVITEEYDPGQEPYQIWQDYFLTGDEW